MTETNVAHWTTIYGPALITAGAIIFSGMIASIGVHRTVKSQRQIAKMRAALDIITRSEEDSFYETLRDTFVEVRDGPGLLSILKAKTEEEKEKRRELQAFLNHHELISISMIEGIIDKKIYKKWMGPSFVNDWNDVAKLVAELRRTKRKTIFKNFEELAVEWGGNSCTIPPE